MKFFLKKLFFKGFFFYETQMKEKLYGVYAITS
jgi:hypothetical protein